MAVSNPNEVSAGVKQRDRQNQVLEEKKLELSLRLEAPHIYRYKISNGSTNGLVAWTGARLPLANPTWRNCVLVRPFFITLLSLDHHHQQRSSSPPSIVSALYRLPLRSSSPPSIVSALYRLPFTAVYPTITQLQIKFYRENFCVDNEIEECHISFLVCTSSSYQAFFNLFPFIRYIERKMQDT
ncbi:hypothetical protein LXL04_024371 [Taraxacum kok-saghyz]